MEVVPRATAIPLARAIQVKCAQNGSKRAALPRLFSCAIHAVGRIIMVSHHFIVECTRIAQDKRGTNAYR